MLTKKKIALKIIVIPLQPFFPGPKTAIEH